MNSSCSPKILPFKKFYLWYQEHLWWHLLSISNHSGSKTKKKQEREREERVGESKKESDRETEREREGRIGEERE